MKQGFSLIELLTVIAILGIISSIAYPSYRNYITRAHRVDGQTALLDLANRMERYYYDNHTYQTATIGHTLTTDVLASSISAAGWYELSITKATDTSYALQATPIKAQAVNDKACQALTLNSLGIKDIAAAITTPQGNSTVCW